MDDDLPTPPDPEVLPGPSRWYVGERGPAGCRVWVVHEDGPEPLPSPASASVWSFAWGRPGASARALAWALLHDATDDTSLADDWCGDFCAEVVSRLPREAFSVTAPEILLWLDVTVPTPGAVRA